MNMIRLLVVWTATILTAALSVSEVCGQDSGSPALARIESGTVMVRWFMVPYIPLPGQERPGMPMVEPREHLLKFNLQDIQAFGPNGKPTGSADWQKALQKETAVLFAGHALTGPNDAVTGRDSLKLPASYAETYRPDALVLVGLRSPVQQSPVKGLAAGFPKGPQPRLGHVWIGQDGFLHLLEQQEYKSHYDAQYPHQPGAAPGRAHIYQTTTTSVTRMLPVADARVSGLDGQPVQAAAAPELQGKWTPVVISADGGPVDPHFLQLVRPGIKVVALPVPAPRPGAGAMPVPPPRPAAAATPKPPPGVGTTVN